MATCLPILEQAINLPTYLGRDGHPLTYLGGDDHPPTYLGGDGYLYPPWATHLRGDGHLSTYFGAVYQLIYLLI